MESAVTVSARKWLDWRYTALAALLTMAILSPFVFCGNDADFLYIFLVAPIVTLTLLILSLVFCRSWRFTTPVVLIVFLCISYVGLRYEYPIRITGRWLVHSKRYKREVMASQPAVAGELQHIDWDGWGFAGNDTEVYLVFDPNDSLHSFTGSNVKNAPGISCEVSSIHRLEKDWYSVEFYTDTGWDDCH